MGDFVDTVVYLDDAPLKLKKKFLLPHKGFLFCVPESTVPRMGFGTFSDVT